MDELERLKKNYFISLNQQNGVITQLNDMILDNQQAIKLLSTKILQTDKQLESLKTYLDGDIKKDIESIINKQLDLNKSINTMSSSVANMYAGLRKKKRKTKRRKRKGTRKKS